VSGSYLDLLKQRGAAQFVTAGFVARLPIAMISLGIVLYVTDLTNSYALAGAMSATFALAAAFIGPLGARLADRYGQDRTVWLLGAGQVAALVLFVVAAGAHVPVVLQFALLIVCGGIAPNIGSLVRARWAYRLSGKPELTSAFALEAVIDEVVYVLGPPLAVALALRFGAWSALVASAVLIAIGATWLSLQRSTQPEPRPRIETHRDHRIFTAPMVVVVVIMMLMGGIFGSFEVTTVAFTRELGQEGGTGIVLAVYALGSLLSGLAVGAIRPSAGMGSQLIVYSAVLAIVVLPLPFVTSVPMLIGVAFIAGVSVSPVLIATVSLVEEVVSGHRLTEALTIAISGVLVGLAIAATASGAIADANPPAMGYWVMTGCGILAFVVAMSTHKILRRLPSRPPVL
jgi:MFS family permease